MITKKLFGITDEGTPVHEYRLTNSQGSMAAILDYGCVVRCLEVYGTDVCLGYDTLEEYLADGVFLGAVVGRYGNRIQEGRFRLNGKTYHLAVNDGPNHLHGGVRGFHRYVWDGEIRGDSLVLSRTSPDGEEGYPGTLHIRVTYRLTEDNALCIAYDAETEGDTVLNPTNHSYFNLNGAGSGTVLGHVLKLNSEAITENDENSLPNGRFLPVEGTPFDFRQPKTLGRDIRQENIQLRYGSGYDHNFVLKGQGLAQAAVLKGDRSGIVMEVLTDRPGMQLYTGNFLTERQGKCGARYCPNDAVCLETQCFPNATEYAHFPSPILHRGEPFHSETVYRFSLGK